uniref:Uncharacterized protein n=1 Tax=Romanomermis culicivorax TaxID=13658 RepID=A0A915JX53_ROMCU
MESQFNSVSLVELPLFGLLVFQRWSILSIYFEYINYDDGVKLFYNG